MWCGSCWQQCLRVEWSGSEGSGGRWCGSDKLGASKTFSHTSRSIEAFLFCFISRKIHFFVCVCDITLFREGMWDSFTRFSLFHSENICGSLNDFSKWKQMYSSCGTRLHSAVTIIYTRTHLTKFSVRFNRLVLVIHFEELDSYLTDWSVKRITSQWHSCSTIWPVENAYVFLLSNCLWPTHTDIGRLIDTTCSIPSPCSIPSSRDGTGGINQPSDVCAYASSALTLTKYTCIFL